MLTTVSTAAILTSISAYEARIPNNEILLVFARGFAVGDAELANIPHPPNMGHWTSSGDLMATFASNMENDPRVSVLILPLFDGIMEIRWKKQGDL